MWKKLFGIAENKIALNTAEYFLRTISCYCASLAWLQLQWNLGTLSCRMGNKNWSVSKGILCQHLYMLNLIFSHLFCLTL
jgi:hypothetical protein